MLKPCADCRRLVYTEEMVTITASEYRELLQRHPRDGGYLGKPSRSKFVNDPELADYLLEVAAAGNTILSDIRAACVGRFGAARVPSRSAIHRYLQAAASKASNAESAQMRRGPG